MAQHDRRASLAKLKKEMDGMCTQKRKSLKAQGVTCAANQDTRREGKWAPKWYIVDNKDKPTVRRTKCKRDRLYRLSYDSENYSGEGH